MKNAIIKCKQTTFKFPIYISYALPLHFSTPTFPLRVPLANFRSNYSPLLFPCSREVAALRDGHLGGNKERLTVEWLQQSIAEIRKQLVELQELASEASKSISHRTQSYEDMATVRSDFTQLKLEVAALRERQQQSEVFIQELREEALQQEEDYKRLLLRAAPSPAVVKGMPAKPELALVEKQEQQQLQQTAQSSEIDSQNNEVSVLHANDFYNVNNAYILCKYVLTVKLPLW